MKKVLSLFKNYKKEIILAPSLKLLEALIDLITPIIVSLIIKKGIEEGDVSYIIKMVILMGGLALIGLVLSISGQFFAAKAAVNYSRDLRSNLFKKLNSLSFSSIDELGVSSIINRMTNDVVIVQNGVNLTLRLFLRSPFIVFGSAICATILYPKLSIIFWISIPVLIIIVYLIMKLSIKGNRIVQERLDDVLNHNRENLTGVRVLRAFTMEEKEIAENEKKVKNLEKRQLIVERISNLLNPLTFLIVNVSIILLIYFGALDVKDNLTDAAIIIALYNYFAQILIELIKMANLVFTITKAITSLKRIAFIMNYDDQEVLVDSKVINDDYLSFNNVSLDYTLDNNDDKDSLNNISFKINKGDKIGIIGGTGSGKTSLVSLILKFYLPTKGQIIYKGKDLLSYKEKDLRDEIGLVMQKPVLFKGTIKSNLEFGKSYSEQEILNALDLACCTDIVQKKEDGINSVVEMAGRNFSGGQKQRLSIARILLRKPEILIFDDSTSALDYQTELSLRHNLNNLTYQPTIFMISQRTSSIEMCDKIIVLDDGKLVGFDTHENLVKNNKIYQEIYYTTVERGDEG